MGGSPRTPSVVSRACKPKPAGRTCANFLSQTHAREPIRLLSTRAPRQAVLRASFRLAPFRSRHETLRSPSGKDARYVQPTSATRTNCVHPHLACFRQPVATFIAWASHGLWGPCDLTGDPSVFTTPETLRRTDKTRFVPRRSSSFEAPCRAASLPMARAWALFFPRSLWRSSL
jgi:hypothetical protein